MGATGGWLPPAELLFFCSVGVAVPGSIPDPLSTAQDADDHAARLESMVRQLWAKVDASVMKAVAGDKKSEAYDGMASLLETKIAQLEQELRAKDKLIRELSTAEPPSPVWLQ